MLSACWVFWCWSAHSADGKSCVRPSIGGHDRDGADEIAVLVAGPKLLLRLRPLGGNLTTAHDVVGLDFENIGEIATHCDLELKAHSLHAVVGNIQVLVHAV